MGTQPLPQKGGGAPNFRPMSIVAKWLMYQDTRKGHSPTNFLAHVYSGQTVGWTKMPLGTEVELDPRPHCVRREPSSPARGAQQPPPIFSARVYCGHGRPSQLLLSSCQNCTKTPLMVMTLRLSTKNIHKSLIAIFVVFLF